MGTSEMESLRKSWCVVMHMLSDRGYLIPEESKYYCLDCDETMDSKKDTCDCYNNFVEWVGEEEPRKNMTFVFSKKDETQKIITFWTANYGVGDVRKIEDQMGQEEVKHAIVVHKNKISSNANTTMKNLKVQGIIIEPFDEQEVQYVVTRSRLVPKHIICAKATTEKILSSYHVKKQELPEIRTTDPIVRWIGARKGQLIKIVRKSESVASSNGENTLFDIFYRIVV